MKLTDLFKIIYASKQVEDEYSDLIENVKINNLLDCSREIFSSFFFVASKNIIFNKTKSKIKLEFHNMDTENLNNDLILKVLNKLKKLINKQSNLMKENESSHMHIEGIEVINQQDNQSQSEEEDTHVEDDEEDTQVEEEDEEEIVEDEEEEDILFNINNNNIQENNLDVVVAPTQEYIDENKDMVKTEHLQLHLFIKNINTDNSVKYLTTFVLNNTNNIKDYLDVNSENFGNIDYNKIEHLFSINYYYENIYRDFDDLGIIFEYLNEFNILDNYLINNLDNVISGFYFNINDISFQILLKLLILTNIGDYGRFNKHFEFFKYQKKSFYDAYFIRNSDADIFERNLRNNIKIWCDKCNDYISDCLKDEFYHNDISGDLCEKCYNFKKELFYNELKRIKKVMLLVGKRAVFKKQVEKTREFLKNKKFKLKKVSYYKLLEKINKNLFQIQTDDENICKICYEPLSSEIYVGSNCGHCFHKQCIELCDSCQICRVPTKFIKLYL